MYDSPVNPHTLRVLEFDAIREMLADRTTSALGRERALALVPGADPALIRETQQTVSEMRKLLQSGHAIPVRGIKDIRGALKRARIDGAMLEPEALLDAASTLETSRRLHAFGKTLAAERPSPRIEALTAGMGRFERIEHEIARAIDSDGTVKDGASDALARIRREQHAVRERTREHLNRLVHSEIGQKALQESVVTLRDGRYVVPVRTDHRTQIQGVIHDQSASGATLFVEPFATVEYNNQLRELEIAERREIDRILTAITALIRDAADAIEESLALLGRFDFYYAAGRLSLDLRATCPRMHEDGRIALQNARHPLLETALADDGAPRKAVPLTIRIDSDTVTLVITGPNMGGKTVALKTVGLLTVMAQCGLHVPADEPADLSVFRGIFADIGDEQSIQANLSTFSSHLRHIIAILNEADDRTLVLLDELGAGTDPAAGAALGMAVLETLTQRRTVTVATTHYGALKDFAARTPGVENGSMAFDVATLAPTYRFRQGIPGGSYAVEIGQRLGLPQPLLDRTTEIIGKDERKLEELIIALDKERRQHETTRAEVERQREILDRLTKEYRDKLETYRQQERELLRKAQEKADRVLRDANAVIERAVADIRSEQASRETIKRARTAVMRQREQVRQLTGTTPAHAPAAQTLAAVNPGDEVWVDSLQKPAAVVAAPDSSGRVRVRAGRVELTVRREDLRAPKQTPPKTEKTAPETPPKTAINVYTGAAAKLEIDVRGYTADAAIDEVDRFLGQASIDGLRQVRILHGKGSGVLRHEIGKFLKTHDLVKETRFAVYNEGGDGVTVVELYE